MAPNKTIILFSVVILVVGALVVSLKPKSKPSPSKISFQNISVQEFDSVRAASNPFVVDVHTPEQNHIPGTDAFIDFTQVKNRLAEFPQDKNAEILVYCRSGSMSLAASQDLVDAGYTNVKNLSGGINAWRSAHQGISLSPETQDLNTVVYGDIASTEFVLTNNLNQTLDITRISSSCSCTKAEIDKTELEPYESITVKVSFNPAVHEDDSDLGDVTRTIFIETSHPDFSKLESTITATVIK